MVRINNLKCKGLYSFKDQIDIDFSDNMVIVGPNNSGKSNIMRILKIIDDTFYYEKSLSYSDVFIGEYNPWLEFSISFSNEETKKIIEYFSFSQNKQNENFDYIEYDNYDVLISLFDSARLCVSWRRGIKDNDLGCYIKLDFEKTGLKFFSPSLYDFHINNSFPKQDVNHPYDGNVRINDLLKLFTDESTAVQTTDKFFTDISNKSIRSSSIQFDNHHTLSPNGAIKMSDLFSYMDLPVKTSVTSTYFAKLLGTIFHKGFQISSGSRGIQSKPLLEVSQEFFTEGPHVTQTNTGNIDDFNTILTNQAFFKSIEFNNVLKPDGSNLISFLFSLKNSTKQDARIKFKKIQKGFHELFQHYGLDFDIILQYTKDQPSIWGNSYLAKHTICKIVIDDKNLKRQFEINNVGAGILESIYLLTLSYGVEESIVLLDEPAVNLHPSLMKSIIKILQKNNAKNQFVIITHSPELTQYEIFENSSFIVYVRKHDNSSTVSTLVGYGKEDFDKDRSKLKHQVDTRIFFANGVLLTEGDSDRNIIGITNHLEDMGNEYDLTAHDIIITSVGGKKSFKKHRKLLDSFGIPYVVLSDMDSKKDVFKDEETGELSKDNFASNSNVVLIKEGDLEDLMESISSEKFSQACKEGGKSKPAVSMEFCRLVSESSLESLKSIKDFIRFCISNSNTR